ncbi:MAG: periplasmic binding protein [Acidimicrobiia bacterium]|nr:MAG: periplasmic binding protein [Acidimicrobiia bacterium]
MNRTRTPRTRAVALAVALAALALGACGGDGGEGDTASATGSASAPADDAFPVTVEHAFGTTEIPEEPQRVVTWGWGSADAAIALGVVPVAIPFQDYGGDEQGVLPWIRDALEERGAEVPTVLPDAQEPPFEAIAAAEPDLILAVYSGITEQDYELLSDIAPTVAYPDQPWATPWRDTIEIVGRALGRAEATREVLTGIDDRVAQAASEHPELAGKTVAMVWDTGDTFYVYKPADARVAFTLDLGLVSAPSVETLAGSAQEDDTFYFTLSPERLGELDSDILVSYADTQEASDAFLASPRASLLPQVQRGTVAEVVGTEFIAAVSPPTALSLTWGLDEYVSILADAARRADAAG